jgi:hypothetical protein
MKLLVDRPDEKVLTIQCGKGEGKQVMADPIWGYDKNPIPVGVRVMISIDSGKKWIGSIYGPFDSIEQAENLTLQLATDWYDRGNAEAIAAIGEVLRLLSLPPEYLDADALAGLRLIADLAQWRELACGPKSLSAR